MSAGKGVIVYGPSVAAGAAGPPADPIMSAREADGDRATRQINNIVPKKLANAFIIHLLSPFFISKNDLHVTLTPVTTGSVLFVF